MAGKGSWLKAFLRRRHFYVHPTLQRPLLLTSFVHGFIAWIVLSTALFAPLMIQLQNPDAGDPETVRAAAGFLQLHRHFWVPSLIAFTLIGLSSIWVSHRIAGPLIRFRRIFNNIRQGGMPRPESLRQGDLLGEEMQLINEMSAALNLRQEKLASAAQDLDRSLSICLERSEALALSELHSELLAAKRDSARIAEVLHGPDEGER